MKARAAEGTCAQASFFSAHSKSALSTGLGSFRSSMPMVGQHPPRWAWRGAHPGAGVTTLARELGGADVGMAATGAATVAATVALPVLVVCRSSETGLIAAQRLAANELAGTPTWTCLGLVVVAAGPSQVTKPVAELTALITGGYPAWWPIPWMESWRTVSSPAAGLWSSPGVLNLFHPSIHPPKEHP